MKTRGKCLCGRISFEVKPPTKWCTHCHCSKCQQAHGSAFVTWFGVEKKQFKLISGDQELKWYSSSSEAERGFCRTCGSTMFFRSSRWAGEMHIVLSNVDEIDRQPSGHVFYDAHVKWFELGDDLKQYGGPSGTELLVK